MAGCSESDEMDSAKPMKLKKAPCVETTCNGWAIRFPSRTGHQNLYNVFFSFQCDGCLLSRKTASEHLSRACLAQFLDGYKLRIILCMSVQSLELKLARTTKLAIKIYGGSTQDRRGSKKVRFLLFSFDLVSSIWSLMVMDSNRGVSYVNASNWTLIFDKRKMKLMGPKFGSNTRVSKFHSNNHLPWCP